MEISFKRSLEKTNMFNTTSHYIAYLMGRLHGKSGKEIYKDEVRYKVEKIMGDLNLPLNGEEEALAEKEITRDTSKPLYQMIRETNKLI